MGTVEKTVSISYGSGGNQMTFQERLNNWGRAYRMHKTPRKHCYSVEWRCENWYSPPDTAQIQWMRQKGLIDDFEAALLMDERPRAKPEPIDHKDAELLERAWATLDDRRAKFALKKHYVNRWTKLMVCRKLREKDIENFFSISEEKFSKQIDFLSSIRNVRVYIRMEITDTASSLDDLRFAA